MPTGSISNKGTVSGFTASSSRSGGDHNKLYNRDAENQHPISAITNLQEELDSKLDSETVLPLIEEAVNGKAKGMYYDANCQLAKKPFWYLTSEVDEVTGQGTIESVISGPYALSSGGEGALTKVTVTNVDPMTGENMWPANAAVDSYCNARIWWQSLKDDEPTPGNGTLRVSINNKVISDLTRSVAQGYVDIDISKYLTAGENAIQVRVMDAYGTTAVVLGNITAVSIRLASNFNDQIAYTGNVNYIYTPYGAIDKTMYFYVDGILNGTAVVKSSGEQQTYVLRGLTHGSHTLRVYFEAELDGETVTSNTLYYDIIHYSEGNTTPIIASQFNELEQEQYIAFNIPYRVYVYGSVLNNIELLVNDEVIQTLSVDTTEHFWEYKSDASDVTVKLAIKCGETEKIFNVHINPTSADVHPVEDNLVLALNTVGRSNDEPIEQRQKWEDAERGISCQLTGFNWASNGWVKDNPTDKNTVLRISGGAQVVIPYKPFAKDLRDSGKTIEIEFATSVVRDYEATIIDCFVEAENKGFYLTPQLAKIKSEQTELQTQYKEDDHVRLDFVIEKRSENRIVYMYINGIMSGALQYPANDSFTQSNPENIRIGSEDAVIDIYNIRVYDNNLTRRQVVNNWIADTQDGALRAVRYHRNDNFNDADELVIEKLPNDLAHIVWDIDPLPQYKGDKRPGQAEFIDPENSDRNFTLNGNGDYNVQGTSSAVYPVKNIRLKSKNGFIDDNGNIEPKFTIRGNKVNDPDEIGANYFTFKVDYASSEGVNNVELVRLYNDASKAHGIFTPPQRLDDKVRVGIDGFPVVAFQRTADNKDIFITKANFNNDKANEDVYGFVDGDESWEITNNSAAEAVFKAPATAETFANAFEIRYPDEDGYSDISKLGPMTEWVYSTYRANATGRAFEEPITFNYTEVVRAEDGTYSTREVSKTFESDTEEYRLTKFKAELKDHFNVDSCVFYYLFTHLYLMIDSRAKNAFPTYYKSRRSGDGGDRWFWLPYDMDTAIGINNEGKLVFDYSLEDTDKVDGADVFNGQDSVMWCNLRDAFDGEIGKMYSELRTSGGLISFESTENRFAEHQNRWSENIFNEDSYVKYVKVLADTGANYLEMLQGAKAQQRRWWLYNRFKYMDSKYLAGEAKQDFLSFRAYNAETAPDITIVPYADIYAVVSYSNAAGAVVSARAHRGEAVTLPNPMTGSFTDQEVYIYSVSQLKSIGDLAPFYPDTIKAENATKLQELKIGDLSPDYVNESLKELTLGNNVLLKSLNVAHCPNLNKEVNMANCTNIEEIYFDGTAVPSVTLPAGAPIRTLHLPDTITNLTLINHTALQDLQLAGLQNIASLRIENISGSVLNYYDTILQLDTSAFKPRVRWTGIEDDYRSLSDEAAIAKLDALYNKLDECSGIAADGSETERAQISGTIKVREMSYAAWKSYYDRYPGINLDVTYLICTVTFYVDDTQYGAEQVLMRGQAAVRPTDPTKESTPAYNYIFTNWDNETVFEAVTKDTAVHAIFEEVDRTYHVTFNSQLEEVTVTPPYADIVYEQAIPEPVISDIPDNVDFLGWFDTNGMKIDFEDGYSTTYRVTEDVMLIAYWNEPGDEDPTIVVSTEAYNLAHILALDNWGIRCWALTDSEEFPSKWTYVELPTKRYEFNLEIEAAGIHYIHVMDIEGHHSYQPIIAYTIEVVQESGKATIQIIDKLAGEEVEEDFALANSLLEVTVLQDVHYKDLVVTLNDIETASQFEATMDGDWIIKTNGTPKDYVVSFNLSGHEVEPIPAQEITYLHKIEEPEKRFDPATREYIDKWYLEPEFINEVDFSAYEVTDNVTLYAQWADYFGKNKLYITIPAETADCTITLRWSQSAENGVGINWGDESAEETVNSQGSVDLTHTYASSGDYIIEINGKQGVYALGHGNGADQGITLPETMDWITDIEFAYDAACNSFAFFDAHNLTEVTLTEYMRSIPEGCFGNTRPGEDVVESKLTTVHMSKDLVTIGSSAFSYCTHLQDFELPKNLKAINQYAFGGCKALTSMSIPDSVTSIGEGAFIECENLESITLPAGLVKLAQQTFAGCSKLLSVDIPESATQVERNVFANCISLEKVIIRAKNQLIWSDGVFNNCMKLTSAGPIGSDCDVEFGWTTDIPNYAFYSTHIVNVILPETLVRIGNFAFGVTNIAEITIPAGVKTIGMWAFRQTQLSDVVLPNGLTSIGDGAFAGTYLVELTIPASVNDIGPRAFENCFALRGKDINIYTSGVKNSSKVTIPANAWFLSVDGAKLHVLDSLTEADTKTVFGEYWNIYNATGPDYPTLQIIPDLQL